jgi:hypothetical protein
MRGDDDRSSHLFSYVSPEQRVPTDHPLREIRTMTDAALRRLSPRFERLYASVGRPSVPPEQLLRALLLQVLYSVRSERLLMEQLQYNLLFRWFVGLDRRSGFGLRPRLRARFPPGFLQDLATFRQAVFSALSCAGIAASCTSSSPCYPEIRPSHQATR